MHSNPLSLLGHSRSLLITTTAHAAAMSEADGKHDVRCSTVSRSTTSVNSSTPEKKSVTSHVDEEKMAETVPVWKPSKQVKLIVIGQSFVVFAISSASQPVELLDLSLLVSGLIDGLFGLAG